MPSKGNINIVHDEQIWRDHIRTGRHKHLNNQGNNFGYQQNEMISMIQFNQRRGVIMSQVNSHADYFPLSNKLSYPTVTFQEGGEAAVVMHKYDTYIMVYKDSFICS